QAEDGIRGFHVTGVQTCALPIFGAQRGPSGGHADARMVRVAHRAEVEATMTETGSEVSGHQASTGAGSGPGLVDRAAAAFAAYKIGRASCRERVCDSVVAA